MGRKQPSSVGRRLFRGALLGALILVPILAIALLWLATRSSAPHFDTAAARGISYTPPRVIVPGPGLPKDLTLYDSNNNVDVVRFGGRFFLGFRTAPTHFASDKTRIYVLSSSDRETWTQEAVFEFPDGDLREPRFLVYNGKLFFYFFRGGQTLYKFEPHYIYACERRPDGSWTTPREIFRPGFVVWRAKVFGRTAYMTVYRGAAEYEEPFGPAEVRLLRSHDGYDWQPISEEPQVADFSASEAAFEFDRDGNLVATVRLELQGGMVCTAPKDNLAQWDCRRSLYKPDSPLMFRRGEDVYVIARRNVAGPFLQDVSFLPERWRRPRALWSLVRYSLTRKRTSLYKVDVAAKTLQPLFDFPSRGDTAFAGVAPLDDSTYYLVNYTSPLDGPDWPWLGGQLATTVLYETEIRFGTIEK